MKNIKSDKKITAWALLLFGILMMILSLLPLLNERQPGDIFAIVSLFLVGTVLLLVGFIPLYRLRHDQEYANKIFFKEEEERARHTVLKAYLVDVDVTIDKASQAFRTISGTLIGGIPGGVIFGLTAKKQEFYQFLVEYADGHFEVVQAKTGTDRYRFLSKAAKQTNLR